MNRDACLAATRAPDLEKHGVTESGVYLHNLRRGEVKRLYQDDEREEFGFRVRAEWNETQCQNGVSVNLDSCLPDPRCSILIHPVPTLYRHVVGIHLPRLRDKLGMEIVAQYDPIESPPENANPAHFLLLPPDEPILDFLMQLRSFMEHEFPPGAKKPRTPQDTEKARENCIMYQQVFQIHRNLTPADS